MPKNLLFIFFLVVVGALAISSFGAPQPTLQQTASSLIFIPLGDLGIHYFGSANHNELIWGPPAFVIAPDDTFWIADTADNRLVQISPTGNFLRTISTRDLAIGIGDIEVTSNEIWALDQAAAPPKLLRLSLDGKLIHTYDLPDNYSLANGLSGLSLDANNDICIEKWNGHVHSCLASKLNQIETIETEGRRYGDMIYTAAPGDLSQAQSSHGFIQMGQKKIEVEVAHNLADLNILHVNPDGSFYAEVVEVVANPSFQIDQKVFLYASDGKLIAMARVPLQDQWTTVRHNLAVSRRNVVYALITHPDGATIEQLAFLETLSPILETQNSRQPIEQHNTSTAQSISTCRTRQEIHQVANSYLENSVYLSTYRINANSSCSEREIPSYLGAAGTYNSVPYAYGIADSPQGFNNSMLTGGAVFAGNKALITLNCARGVDCSGLVTKAWDIPQPHVGTCTLEGYSSIIPSVYGLQMGDIMNKCATIGHVMIFRSFGPYNTINVTEATTELNYDRVVLASHLVTDLYEYTPRRYNNTCGYYYAYMPITINDASTSTMSYPSPYPSPNSSPYP
jgi:hypothetical protein